MNNLEIYSKTKDNIFEWRAKQYSRYIDSMMNLIKDFRYFMAEYIDEEVESFEVNPSIFRKINVEYHHSSRKRDHIISKLEVKVPYPLKDNMFAFKVDGHIRFPIFQWYDDMYYSNKIGVVYVNSPFIKKKMRLVNKDLESQCGNWYVEIERRSFPLIGMLMLCYNNLDELLRDCRIREYKVVPIGSNNPNEYDIKVRISKSEELLYNTSGNEFFERLLSGLHVLPLRHIDETVENFNSYKLRVINHVLNGRNIGNLKRAKSLYAQVLLKEPTTNLSALDIIQMLVMTNEINNVEVRIANDLSKKRLRLIEPLLYKLYSMVVSASSADDKTYQLLSTELILKNMHGELIQFDNSVNPINQLAIQSRVTFLGKGGFPRKAASMELRGLHESYKGIIDPVDTPLGSNSGIVNFLTPLLKLDEIGRHKNNLYYKKNVKGESNG